VAAALGREPDPFRQGRDRASVQGGAVLPVKVLITGAAGQVGRALLGSVPAQMEVRAFTREQLDIRDAGAVRSVVAAFEPSLIINTAAYTAVDKAESEPELALAINAEGPRHLAQAAHALPGCRLDRKSTRLNSSHLG